MESPGLKDRFSRQTILPGVGAEGQVKWESASVQLAGEGSALEAAQTALSRSGLSRLKLLDPQEKAGLQPVGLILVVTRDSDWRRRLNRQVRSTAQAALFAWRGGSGFSLFLKGSSKGCPCLECFEASNPKAFSVPVGKAAEISAGEFALDRIMGAMAATEALQWILRGTSPLEGKVWMNSFEDGLSLQHEVRASANCPAASSEAGKAPIP